MTPTPERSIPVDSQQVIRNLADRVAALTVQVAQWEAAYDALTQAASSPAVSVPPGGETRD